MSNDTDKHPFQGFSGLRALYINWDFADGIFRHPLQFFKYLNQAKHKASGGRSISGMTAPKEK